MNELAQRYGSAVLTPDYSVSLWLDDLSKLWTQRVATGWAFAHWLRAGIDTFSARQEVGELYQAASEASGLAVKTLQNYVSIARKFPVERIPEGVDIGHANALLGLSEDAADYWLHKVTAEGMSVERLRKEVFSPGEPGVRMLSVPMHPEQMALAIIGRLDNNEVQALIQELSHLLYLRSPTR